MDIDTGITSEVLTIKSEIKLANIKSIYIVKRITSFIKEV